ncbi:hypothetical protein NK718_09670 [Alsobacter sp. SYSU M60028]|uniref:Uncharacterized protein n=1 Tax=Alsobacter ponti TaxID=2962936 RepID=A0ABT1LCW4_9HYPH|nr:hypothetical protein [Alsobacter ponti]MCP8938781.1 hypothetical protein [Alsobacter ponti]
MRPEARRPLRSEIEDVEAEHADRMTANLLAVIVCLLLIGAGLFLVEGLDRAAKVQACFEAGRRVCASQGLRP